MNRIYCSIKLKQITILRTAIDTLVMELARKSYKGHTDGKMR